ncbi:EH signature domain-containing protein [Anabaenopsis tanganyikae CS-531]|uniref:EH signature domain-containing protein n=2 Tax=Anabaenopsis TaxID=110103 RepID=A0ABT5AQG4_9CYAN|nr:MULTISPECIES: EH signature domain-containing protein [Anabaenopsis]MDB9539553.1 EH signature domain-containing protein [Anabaenopsis arnoldii]MDH6091858.1 EH signature domain-containing protein [Anabaenopsis arnoldii]MDH6105943.1 EH signature domain-containing protein [Anabaenopsis tanganyikae CS-531]
MMLNFRTLSLSDRQSPEPTNLLQLVKNFRNSEQFRQLQNLPNVETDTWRSLDQIIETIQSGNIDDIQHIEWVYCLHNKAEWDRAHPEISYTTSALIWRAAVNNLPLKQTLLWLLVLNHSESQPIISESLVTSFSVFIRESGDSDAQILQIIQAITQDDYHRLALIARDENFTPQELLNKYNLPSTSNAVSQALNYVVRIFSDRNDRPEWLLRCFAQMSHSQQCQEVNRLLTTIAAEIGSGFLSIVEWLRQNYGPRTVNSRWSQLSSQAQLALRKWIGAATWGDFDRMITVLINKLSSQLQTLSQNNNRYQELNYQRNQLQRRKGFWSNYSDRFERLRILVPASTSWISQELTRDIDLLVNDGSNETEICIFDFGDWFIVEFFRGNGSEILMFNRNYSANVEKTLFQSPNLSISDIRRLYRFGGEIHDHVFLWQYYAEKWLRTQHNIYPNDGITRFQGLGSQYNQFSHTTGLPTPAVDKQGIREQKLARWRRDIQRIYQALGISLNNWGN